MAIVFVHSTPFPRYSGGVDNWLFHLITEFDRRHVPVVLFAPVSSDPIFYDISGFQNLRLIGTPSIQRHERAYAFIKKILPSLWFVPIGVNFLLWTVGAWWVIRRHVRKQDRLVALHSIPAMLPLVLFRCLGGRTPITCSVRGRIGEDLKGLNRPVLAWIYTQLEKAVLSFAAQLVSNGEDTAAYVWRDLGRETEVIPNGVDFARFASSNSHPCQEENPRIAELVRLRQQKVARIMTVATLRDVKGIGFLIEAAAHLQKEFDGPFKVIFVGKGDPSAYQEYAARLGAAERVMFVGEQKDVASFLRLADVTVAMFGGGGVIHAVLEMMAAGKPIVAWDNLTYSQILTHGASGHLVKDRDSLALARGILTLLRDAEYAASLAKSAQQVAKKYDWQIIAEKFLEVIGQD